MLTVITRTSNRPNYFANCRRSVLEQTLPAFHLVGTDDPADTYPEGDKVVQLPPRRGRDSNLHFNDLIHHVPDTHPWVVFLDDDDVLLRKDSLAFIGLYIGFILGRPDYKKEDHLILWKMRRLDHTIPDLVGDIPKFGNITGGAVCFHKRHWRDWDNKSGADFRFISYLYSRLYPVWIDAVLTAMQTGPGMGQRKDLHE
jgi:glycosyltransferase involved in cell wall biosynthesis